MRKMLLTTISMLVACGTVYAAGSPETPATTPAAATPAAATPAAATPAAAVPATPATTPAATTPAATSTTPAATAPATATPATANASLSGKWSSNLVGNVTIEQTGNKITGSYHHTDDDNVTQDGKLEGVIEGKTIKAK